MVGRQLEAGGVAEDKLLQADAGAESKGPRAQPADRPSRDLEDPCRLVIQADLGVDRAFAKAERARDASEIGAALALPSRSRE